MVPPLAFRARAQTVGGLLGLQRRVSLAAARRLRCRPMRSRKWAARPNPHDSTVPGDRVASTARERSSHPSGKPSSHPAAGACGRTSRGPRVAGSWMSPPDSSGVTSMRHGESVTATLHETVTADPSVSRGSKGTPTDRPGRVPGLAPAAQGWVGSGAELSHPTAAQGQPVAIASPLGDVRTDLGRP